MTALVIRARRPDAGDRRRHLHREGCRRAPRPHPPHARTGRDQLAARRRRRRVAARAALDELDGAAVSTLHAFAQRLLSENPIEAGLPPRIDVLDDIGSQVAFEDRWMRFVDLLLDDPALERALLLALNADTGLSVLRTIALACNANWDLVQERMGPEPDPPPLEIGALLAELRSVCAMASSCADPDDKLALGLGRAVHMGRPLRTRPRRVRAAPLARPTASPEDHQDRGQEGQLAIARATCKRVRERRPSRCREQRRGPHRRGHRGHHPAPGVGDRGSSRSREADERRQSGQLEFHDLLVLARSVLRDPEHGWDVRRRLRARYTHLLLDEFQDTDPDPVRPRRAPRIGRPRRA